jgi:hypothetical protein
VSASAYCQRATDERSARSIEDERLLERIRALQATNYHAYGYRRTWKALRREGVQVGRDRVKRLMRVNPIIRGWGNYYRRAHVRWLYQRPIRWIVLRVWSHQHKRRRKAGWRHLPAKRLYGGWAWSISCS